MFTLPVAALVGALAGKLANQGNAGVAVVGLVAVVLIGFIVVRSRRSPVTAGNVNDAPTVSLRGEPELAPTP